MVKTTLSLIVVCLILFAGASSVNAQTSVAFGNGTSTGQITFISNGNGTASVDLGTCGGGIPDTCIVSGSNSGGGGYSFTTIESGANDIQAGAYFNGGDHLISMNGATTTFMWNDGGVNSLTGTVVWGDVITNGHALFTGTLTITSSTFSGVLATGGTATIDFNTNGYSAPLNSIFTGPLGTSEGATLSSGEFSAPEPSSMLLLGTGLLLAGGILRRRLAMLA